MKRYAKYCFIIVCSVVFIAVLNFRIHQAKAGDLLKVTPDGNNFIVESKSGKFRAKQKDDGYKIYLPNDSVLFTIKMSEQKIKIYKGDKSGEPWVIKEKDEPDAYKVKLGDVKIGKIKFHPDSGKVKAKDEAGNELCAYKAPALTMAPVVCFMKEVDEEHKQVLSEFLKAIKK